MLSESQRQTILAELSDDEIVALDYDWRFWARPKQVAPAGDWFCWVIRAGRGFGKTRSGAGWAHERAMAQPGRWVALVARNPADARDYMIEGPGGVLRNTPPWERPKYEPSKRRLIWPNESWATIYSSEEPEMLRGFSGDTFWLDEFGKWKKPKECWDNLMFGMREVSEDRPRGCITTTPRRLKTLQEIEEMEGTVVVTGSSYENRANLDPRWFDEILSRYEGTTLGRQEIWAEILKDIEGALWTSGLIEQNRVQEAPDLYRVVVAIDPQAANNENSSETGICAAGVGAGDHGYLLADESLKANPQEWARCAVRLYHKLEADCIVGEVNNGGDMVEYTVRTIDPNVNFRKITASRGKYVRAEPISALYEQGRFHHVGLFPELEDQMTTWLPGQKSPDRIDALVWAATELMLDSGSRAGTVW